MILSYSVEKKVVCEGKVEKAATKEQEKRKKKKEKEESREGLKKVKNIYNNTNIIEKSD